MLGTTGRPIQRPVRLPRASVPPPSRRRHAALGAGAVRAAALLAQDAARLRRSRAQARSADLHPCLRDARPGADRARAIRRSRRLADQLSGEQRPARAASSTSCTASGSRAPEMDRMAAADAGIVLNHLSNMKLKSGIAPVLRPARGRRAARARLRQLQRHRRAERVPGDEDVLPARGGERSGARCRRSRTRCSATRRSAMRARPASTGKLGAIKPGYKADLVLIDLNDTAYLPYNSAARQLVYTEAGRGVDSVIIDGRVVMKERTRHDHRRGGAAPRGREPDAPLHRRLRRGGRLARARAAVPAGRAPANVGARSGHAAVCRADAVGAARGAAPERFRVSAA